MNIASMVLGIISIVFTFFCQCVSIITAPIGLILGIVDIKKNPSKPKGMAITGIVLSSISLVIFVAILLFFGGIGVLGSF